MTNQEYKKICDFIDKQIITEWISTNYQMQFVKLGGITRIKEELKKLVKE